MWHEIGNEFVDAVLNFFLTDEISVELNNAVTSLVPKTDSPGTTIDYRPIACGNTLYKCISKMLCTCLVEVLPYLVHNNQGAFIKNRSTAHNVLIFQDLLKGYTRKNISSKCILKMDLSKAYDTIDWDFSADLLKALCFPSKFIKWIMHASQDTKFKFHPMCKSLKLMNLCFDDELVIFCKGSIDSVRLVQTTFQDFCDTSGLAANKNKSQIYFGGVDEANKQCMLAVVNIVEWSFPLKYLGVPLRPTKWKASDCGLNLKKIQLRLHTWASRHLSFARRAQLIQLILIGIRSYWMSIFLLPQKVVFEIDKFCRMFLWGVKENRCMILLTSWEQVCLHKEYGGIGFREESKWNKALLAKYVWAISTKKDCIWVKRVNNVYLRDQDFWSYSLK
ncbi:uncharacterized protein LOC133832909 [Humulus lupulus]|uniref:uncharacterized protein LOC133832909 n=1 Tax=Humulus lupulus TaxID=3486 RepID=UPI002B412928|nr:uncharacterized protein LOC133832909 [Humulus lupulus]